LYELVDSMMAEIQVLKGQVQGLQGQVQGLKGDVQGLQGQVQGLQGQVQGLKGDVKGLQGRVDFLRERLQYTNDRFGPVKQRLKQDIMDSLKIANGQSQSKCDRLERSIVHLQTKALQEEYRGSLRDAKFGTQAHWNREVEDKFDEKFAKQKEKMDMIYIALFDKVHGVTPASALAANVAMFCELLDIHNSVSHRFGEITQTLEEHTGSLATMFEDIIDLDNGRRIPRYRQ